MRTEQTTADVAALLRARHTLVWIVTREEVRVERALVEAAGQARMDVRLWDCATGITNGAGEKVEDVRDPGKVASYVGEKRERFVAILRDYHSWLKDPFVLRAIRSLARDLQSAPTDEARSVVILSPSAEIPPELSGSATVIEWPLPDRDEIAALLDDVLEALPEDFRAKAAPENGTKDAAIDAAVGLSAEEAANCYARSLVTSKRIDPVVVSAEKKRVIARERVLTWHDPDPRGLDAVGGLDALKSWLVARRVGFTAKARAFGLPAPKGALLVGVPGCGKSLTAKAVAAAYQMPLLRLDLGALRGKFVGESEGNIRKALSVAETVAPCVLWLDEIEKSLAGATGPQGDGGVAADALGAVLSWMQERAGAVFVVATANDVSALPPELLRKGRFDEMFFIDLPTSEEREAIIGAALAEHGRTAEGIETAEVARATELFTGAEIAALVPDALFVAFADDEREIRTEDLVEAAASVSPLAKTAAEKLSKLREWAVGRTRSASAPASSSEVASRRVRSIDLEV